MRHIRGRQIGAIFQEPLTTLNPLYSVGRQLAETMQTHLRLSTGEARERAIEMAGGGRNPGRRERIDAYPHEFSGGMRQRVVSRSRSAPSRGCDRRRADTALDVSVQAQIIALLKRLAASTARR